MEFEHTPREMAEKLMEFNRDFSTDSTCGEESEEKELDYVTELFEKLQKSEEFNVLAHHLDLMFMDSAFCKQMWHFKEAKQMGLEEILKELGSETPFDETGDLTSEGADAFDKLLRIVDGLDYIGALGKKGDELETYLDEIIRLGF